MFKALTNPAAMQEEVALHPKPATASAEKTLLRVLQAQRSQGAQKQTSITGQDPQERNLLPLGC
jgi:hypothetical protein